MINTGQIVNTDCVIVGAGLAGLSAGRYLLKELKVDNFVILEAGDRAGGRVQTITTPQGNKADLGVNSSRKKKKLGFPE